MFHATKLRTVFITLEMSFIYELKKYILTSKIESKSFSSRMISEQKLIYLLLIVFLLYKKSALFFSRSRLWVTRPIWAHPYLSRGKLSNWKQKWLNLPDDPIYFLYKSFLQKKASYSFRTIKFFFFGGKMFKAKTYRRQTFRHQKLWAPNTRHQKVE